MKMIYTLLICMMSLAVIGATVSSEYSEAREATPEVSLSLSTDTVIVQEHQTIKLTIKNPTNTAIQIPTRDLGRSSGFIAFSLFRSDGTQVPSDNQGQLIEATEAMVQSLKPGESITWEWITASLGLRMGEPGKYRIHAKIYIDKQITGAVADLKIIEPTDKEILKSTTIKLSDADWATETEKANVQIIRVVDRISLYYRLSIEDKTYFTMRIADAVSTGTLKAEGDGDQISITYKDAEGHTQTRVINTIDGTPVTESSNLK